MRYLFPLLLAGLIAACTAPTPDEPSAHESDEEPSEELAPYMASLQRFAEKLYLAGSEENWALADFYEHEIAEVSEEIVAGGFEEDGHDVSALMQTMLLPALERIEEAIETQSPETFDAAYGALLGGCNGCHTTTEHGFIQLVVPRTNAYPSQSFAP